MGNAVSIYNTETTLGKIKWRLYMAYLNKYEKKEDLRNF